MAQLGTAFKKLFLILCCIYALLLRWAAFERVSTVTVHAHDRTSIFDVRSAMLTPQGTPIDEDYDPRAHREPPTKISPWMAYFNIIRSSFGAGVLGMPLAISQSGIILGPIFAVATGLLVIHTHLMLLNSLNEVSKRLKLPYISYRYGFRLALLHGPPVFHWVGRRGPTIIAVFMLMSQIGICTVFVDFSADSLRDVMDWQDTKTALLCLLLPYMLLEFLMKSLTIVSYISMLGNLLNVAGIGLIFYHILLDPQKEYVYANFEAMPLLFAFGTMLFNLSAVGVVLSIDKALQNPALMVEKFGIVPLGMLIPTIISTVFGTLGYWSFGTMEENVIRSLPYDDNSVMVVTGLYLFTVALTYPIQCYPGILMIIDVIKNYNLHSMPTVGTMKLVENIARPTFMLTTFMISSAIPYQAPFVAFVGNLCTAMLALVFPATMEISLMYPGPYGKFKFYLIKNLLIILLGLILWTFGAVLCVYLIYIRFMASYSPNDTDFFR